MTRSPGTRLHLALQLWKAGNEFWAIISCEQDILSGMMMMIIIIMMMGDDIKNNKKFTSLQKKKFFNELLFILSHLSFYFVPSRYRQSFTFITTIIIIALDRFLFFIICGLLSLLGRDSTVLSHCLFGGFQFRVVLIV